MFPIEENEILNAVGILTITQNVSPKSPENIYS